MNFKSFLKGPEPARSHLATAFQRGIDPNDPSTLGYHGTSVQALEHALETGSLTVTRGMAGVSGGDHYKGRAYGIHLVPNPGNRRAMELDFRGPLHRGFKSPMEDALGWAKHIGERHHIMSSHGLDMSKPSHHRAADEIHSLVPPEKATRGIRTGTPRPDAVHGGVVLAISDRAAERFGISVGGDGNDVNLETRNLPVEFITGIEPQNDAAYEWLDSLGGP